MNQDPQGVETRTDHPMHAIDYRTMQALEITIFTIAGLGLWALVWLLGKNVGWFLIPYLAAVIVRFAYNMKHAQDKVDKINRRRAQHEAKSKRR